MKKLQLLLKEGKETLKLLGLTEEEYAFYSVLNENETKNKNDNKHKWN